jgi:hypothetical protein
MDLLCQGVPIFARTAPSTPPLYVADSGASWAYICACCEDAVNAACKVLHSVCGRALHLSLLLPAPAQPLSFPAFSRGIADVFAYEPQALYLRISHSRPRRFSSRAVPSSAAYVRPLSRFPVANFYDFWSISHSSPLPLVMSLPRINPVKRLQHDYSISANHTHA